MTSYRYTARTGSGEAVTGLIEAGAPAEAAVMLRTRALFVTSVTRPRRYAEPWGRPPSARGDARVAFFRSFAALAGGGVPVRRALAVLAEHAPSGSFRSDLRSVAADIESGASVSAALARHPQHFPRLIVAMVRAGESAGALDIALARLAELLERRRRFAAKIVSALVYPAIVASASVVSIVFIVTSVVPQFARMYAELHVDLPPETHALIAFAWCARTSSVPLLAIAAGVALSMTLASVRETASSLALRVPVLGAVLRKAAVARFARTLAGLLGVGVDVIEALEVSGASLGHAALERGVTAAAGRLRSGGTISDALRACMMFDAVGLQLIEAGEEGGTIDAMLTRIAEYAQTDVDAALAALAASLEPFLVVALGAVVGCIVFSVFIPLYSLIGRIK